MHCGGPWPAGFLCVRHLVLEGQILMEWWLIVLLIFVGIGIGVLLCAFWFVWSFKDFMG